MATNLSTYEWFIKQDLSNFAGKWIAIIDKKIVASDQNVDKVFFEMKKKYPKHRPFLTKVKNKLSIL